MPPGAIADRTWRNRAGPSRAGTASKMPVACPLRRLSDQPIESIPGRGVVDIRVGRRCSGALQTPVRRRAARSARLHSSGPQRREERRARPHWLGDPRVATVAGDRDAVFARLLNLRPPGRPHQYGRTRVGAVLEWSAAPALPTTGSLRRTGSRRSESLSRCSVAPSAKRTSTRPFWVRSRSPASNGIEAGEVSGRPSRSREAVPSTTEMCAGGSGDAS